MFWIQKVHDMKVPKTTSLTPLQNGHDFNTTPYSNWTLLVKSYRAPFWTFFCWHLKANYYDFYDVFQWHLMNKDHKIIKIIKSRQGFSLLLKMQCSMNFQELLKTHRFYKQKQASKSKSQSASDAQTLL